MASHGLEANQRIFDSVAHEYEDLALKPAERTVLARLAPTLGKASMLDLGIGAGRTGYTFAPLVKRYVGVDYAPQMVERARALIGSDPNVELVLGDARDLAEIEGEFDFVLFSFNGIDAIGHDDRLRVLAEVRRVLAPGGHFLFSTHSLWALPLERHQQRSPTRMRSRAYRLYAAVDDFRHGRRIDAVNAGLDLDAARERGWVIVKGRGHGFTIDDYYVDPPFQVEQLREAGLSTVAILDANGNEVDAGYRGRDAWLDYLSTPLESAA